MYGTLVAPSKSKEGGLEESVKTRGGRTSAPDLRLALFGSGTTSLLLLLAALDISSDHVTLISTPLVLSSTQTVLLGHMIGDRYIAMKSARWAKCC